MSEEADTDEIPSIFPVIREIDKRRTVRSRLPAQPTSRGCSGSLPTFTAAPRRTAELRQQMAFSERAFQWENPAFLPVYLFTPLLAVTLAAELMSRAKISKIY